MRFLFFLFFCVGMLCIPVGFKQLTHGFRLAKLRLEFPNDSKWEVPPPSEMQKSLLQQPFTYLDRGAQCYVFLSADRQVVLKLFRYDQPLNPLRFLFRLWFRTPKPKTPFPEKIEKFFSACLLASQCRREETGLLYLHLNRTHHLLPKAKITSPLGRTYEIPLDEVRFALQKKVETMSEIFANLYARRDREEAKKHLRSLLELVQKRREKGILNSDLNLSRNYGFFEGKAVEIDFGSYCLSPGTDQEEQKFRDQLKEFLGQVTPEWTALAEELR